MKSPGLELIDARIWADDSNKPRASSLSTLGIPTGLAISLSRCAFNGVCKFRSASSCEFEFGVVYSSISKFSSLVCFSLIPTLLDIVSATLPRVFSNLAAWSRRFWLVSARFS